MKTYNLPKKTEKLVFAYLILCGIVANMLWIYGNTKTIIELLSEVKVITVVSAHVDRPEPAGESDPVVVERDLPEEWDGTARVTAYSELDSCHYPDGKGGCLNAYGKTIQIGEIACPLKYPKGTKIEIENMGEFTCMDKTAEWVQNDLGMTLDIWVGMGEESHRKALEFGSQQLKFKVKK